MADGRAFTIYSPSCSLNQYYQQKYNLKDSNEYRQFLQKNADKLREEMEKCLPKDDCDICPVCKRSTATKQ
jgi:hypothetical protein